MECDERECGSATMNSAKTRCSSDEAGLKALSFGYVKQLLQGNLPPGSVRAEAMPLLLVE